MALNAGMRLAPLIIMGESRRRDPREVLNELRWREPPRLAQATLWVLNRRRPEGYSTIPGSEVVVLGKSFFETTRATIPYHRIFRIAVGGEVAYERPGFKGGGSSS